MLSGEDFGYLKDEEQNRAIIIVKKALLLGSVLFSISCFVYITVNAYYFAYHDKDSDVKVIKSPSEPIKVIKEGEGIIIKDIDKTIYDNIVGNRNLARENLNNVKILEQVTTPLVRKRVPALIKENLNNNFGNKSSLTRKEKNSKIIVNGQNKRPNKAGDKMVVYNTNKQNHVSDISLKSRRKNTKAATTKKKSIRKKKSLRGLSRVQVAAFSSRESAVNYWSTLNKDYSNLVSRLNYFISEANLGNKGIFYRLQIGNFRNQVDAEEFCRKFISQAGKTRADCIIVE